MEIEDKYIPQLKEFTNKSLKNNLELKPKEFLQTEERD
jgi:hypothetical protein